MRIAIVLVSLLAFALISTPVLAHPVSWYAVGMVQAARIHTSSIKNLCVLPSGGVIAGLERVELDVVDSSGYPATTIVCLADTACSCAAVTASTPIVAEGEVITGELVASGVYPQ